MDEHEPSLYTAATQRSQVRQAPSSRHDPACMHACMHAGRQAASHTFLGVHGHLLAQVVDWVGLEVRRGPAGYLNELPAGIDKASLPAACSRGGKHWSVSSEPRNVAH